MSQTVVEDTLLRAPELLLPNGRPVSPVRCAIPGMVFFASLFRGKSLVGVSGSIATSDGQFTPRGATIVNRDTYMLATLAGAPGTGAFTCLLEVFVNFDAFNYVVGGSLIISAAHSSFGNEPIVFMAGGDAMEPPGAVALAAGMHRIGVSRSNNSKITRVAVDGKYWGEASYSQAVVSYTQLSFNGYGMGPTYGLSQGVSGNTMYRSAILTSADTSGGLLAEYTRDSAAWWKPL